MSLAPWLAAELGLAVLSDVLGRIVSLLDSLLSERFTNDTSVLLILALEFEVFQRFKELSEGKTAVLISHRFSSVRMADRILVLAAGEVEAMGTHEELLAQGGRYSELFELQAAGYR
jgi:ABC-type histidine transport system ATPase subunit